MLSVRPGGHEMKECLRKPTTITAASPTSDPNLPSDETASWGKERPSVCLYYRVEGNYHFKCPLIMMASIPAEPLRVRALGSRYFWPKYHGCDGMDSGGISGSMTGIVVLEARGLRECSSGTESKSGLSSEDRESASAYLRTVVYTDFIMVIP
ncbi:hypothetical protein Scep_016836 [Stephania cephalantha]|uniref:Uncharacterized protein n=1 Tax=Stephania cephalantha TaxID=152367 RepID=A0AAP0IPR9_9MAGN